MNSLLEILTHRVSSSRLVEPGPTQPQLDSLLNAASRAADHGMLKPYRFLTVTDAGLSRLGDLFCHAALADNPYVDLNEQARFKSLPSRAPLVLVAIAVCQPHPKVPEIEQQLTAAAAVQNIINAAYALALGAYWRTGSFAYHPLVKKGLGLSDNEHVIGFVYLGTPSTPLRTLRDCDQQVKCAAWPSTE